MVLWRVSRNFAPQIEIISTMGKVFTRRQKNVLKRIDLLNQRLRVAPVTKNIVKTAADRNIEVLRSLEKKVAAVAQ